MLDYKDIIPYILYNSVKNIPFSEKSFRKRNRALICRLYMLKYRKTSYMEATQ